MYSNNLPFHTNQHQHHFHFLPPHHLHLKNAIQQDISQLLNKQETTQVQQIIGRLLYYARALDNTLLVALNTISQTQANDKTV